MIQEKTAVLSTNIYTAENLLSVEKKNAIIQFLFTHLEQYGDKKEDIEKCFNYALGSQHDGGFIIEALYDNSLVGVSIINKTGMEGYIPENILVYIATHKDYRGKGIGSKLLKDIIDNCEGNIALHVEPDNPALQLYEKFGFTNKYLEMRLNKKGD